MTGFHKPVMAKRRRKKIQLSLKTAGIVATAVAAVGVVVAALALPLKPSTLVEDPAAEVRSIETALLLPAQPAPAIPTPAVAADADAGAGASLPAAPQFSAQPLPVVDPSPPADNVTLAPSPSPVWRHAEVQPGDTLSSIFARLGLKTEDMYALLNSGADAKALERVFPGHRLKVLTDTDSALQELVYEADRLQGIKVKRRDSGFTVSKYAHRLETRTAFAAGQVQSSLYRAAKNAGLSERIIVAMSNIFGWKIDFSQDVAPGDTFIVIYEEQRYQGDKISDGAILAAEFTNRGKTHRAIGLVNAKGVMEYYTPEGKSLKQAFMRYPVDFTRISSRFRKNRFHPVLGKRRPHRGVDYAARTGTPIKASGDGRVSFIGRKGGYGKTVMLNHGNGYETLYAHLSRYRKGLKSGSRVAQGDVIGYVGQTGLATGPHLHYEFRINGVHKDPMKVKLPGKHIDPKQKAGFLKVAERYGAQLDLHRRTQLAAAADN